ncbi:MAG: hypothetical protein ABIN67_00780 [Ferruginibacter sp.]
MLSLPGFLTIGVFLVLIMIDAGLFDPIIAAIVRLVKGDPLKIIIGTTILL